jgi:hypothetical protein
VFTDNLIDRIHRLEIVFGVGHGGKAIITSANGRRYIFEDFEEVAMTTLADYKVLRDTKFTLTSGRQETLEFDLPGNIVRSGNSERPMLSFFSDPSGDARTFRYTDPGKWQSSTRLYLFRGRRTPAHGGRAA